MAKSLNEQFSSRSLSDKFDSTADKPSSAPETKAAAPEEPKSPETKFTSKEVVQDTSKMDTSADAKANAALMARQSAASKKPARTARIVKSEPAGSGKPPDAKASEGKPSTPTVSSKVETTSPPKTSAPKVAPAGGSDFASRFKQATATHAANSPKSDPSPAVVRRSNTGAPLTSRQIAGQDKAKANTATNQAAARRSIATAKNQTERDKAQAAVARVEKMRKDAGYAKGGKTNPFAKKGAEAKDKAFKDKPNPFGKPQAQPFGKKDNPFKKKGNPFAGAKPFAKGGKIDGCAIRGHTKAKRST